jgi:hypothetical protein
MYKALLAGVAGGGLLLVGGAVSSPAECLGVGCNPSADGRVLAEPLDLYRTDHKYPFWGFGGFAGTRPQASHSRVASDVSRGLAQTADEPASSPLAEPSAAPEESGARTTLYIIKTGSVE